MNDTFRATLRAVANASGKVELSADVLIECLDVVERVAYSDGVCWVVEQFVINKRPFGEIVAEARKRSDGLAADLEEMQQRVKANV